MVCKGKFFLSVKFDGLTWDVLIYNIKLRTQLKFLQKCWSENLRALNQNFYEN